MKKKRIDSGTPRTHTAFFIINGEIGDVFYTEKMDKDITAIANHYGRKVQTERVTVVEGGTMNPSAKPLTKVILL